MLECLQYCHLEDVKTTRRYFTWNNEQEGDKRVFSSIDRALTDVECSDKYEMAEVVYLPKGSFDHTPLLLCIYPDTRLKRSSNSIICSVLSLIY